MGRKKERKCLINLEIDKYSIINGLPLIAFTATTISDKEHQEHCTLLHHALTIQSL